MVRTLVDSSAPPAHLNEFPFLVRPPLDTRTGEQGVLRYMATKRMLIDAAHQEETRVALLNGNQLEELDVESSARKQLKGNIYLAKVTRVEPSLQAAFVDYGGNRHGFLAFSEIHPDYYQIPVADREQLIAEDEQAREADTESDDDDDTGDGDEGTSAKAVETLGGDDIDEVEDRRRNKPVRRYKIQEVIKRRQILLVQVVKEERGNKGAALTTYLSLAGRYCVLMPNTGKGGGISRKIGSGADRKRLKTIVNDLDIPDGMAVIVRTAGAERGKAELKRDFEYLIRLWNDVRELTLASTAPALIHEEANIIKRALRDMYTRDVDEVFVEGDEGYRMAKDLMKLLVPSHAKRVQPYKDPIVPVFSRYNIENQLESMIGQEVQLKSGGYIVMNATEALVAVDVNSGRSTRGRNIEETALKTNLEAATEIARQLRLRDMAGLIVIDFIDMDFHRNQTAVERRLKEGMRRDRARIQIGRISPFGLLELSRQRLRPSITETTTDVCPHCAGSGILRSTESTALHVLRGIEEECAKKSAAVMTVAMPSSAALYILNYKREALAEIEQKFDVKIDISVEASLIPPNFTIQRSKTDGDDQDSRGAAASDGDQENGDDEPKRRKRRRSRRRKRGEQETSEEGVDQGAPPNENNHEDDEDASSAVDASNDEEGSSDDEKPRRRRRRRGGRRRGPRDEQTLDASDESIPTPDASPADSPASSSPAGESVAGVETETDTATDISTGTDGNTRSEKDPKPKRRRRVRRKDFSETATNDAASEPKTADDQPAPSDTASKSAGTPILDDADGADSGSTDKGPEAMDTPPVPASDSPASNNPAREVTIVDDGASEDNIKSSRKGWWQKLVE